MAMTVEAYYAEDIDSEGADTAMAPIAGHRWK